MNRLKKSIAAICAVSMLAQVTMLPCSAEEDAVTAEKDAVAGRQLLGETDFDYKMLPWHIVEASPAKQRFEITPEGEAHMMILTSWGEEKEKWDLAFRHKNLDFKAGHTYEIECRVKSDREGLELCSQIQNITGSEYYCVLDRDKFHNGHDMGGEWGRAAKLTTEYQTMKGEFKPTEDLEGCVWTFEYAKGTQYEGNAQDGDELWFDYVSIIDKDAEAGEGNSCDYGYTGRKFSGLENNCISVNQLGYFPEARKIAVLGDNAGDITPDGVCISEVKIDKPELTESVDFEVINASTGESVYKGKSSEPKKDADSGDIVCKLDFSDVTEPGRYYIKSGDYRSFEFRIGSDIYSEKGHDLLTNSLNYFYQNRSGMKIEMPYITSGDRTSRPLFEHEAGHAEDIASVQKIWRWDYGSGKEADGVYASSTIDVTGGWYESSGNTKSMINGGMAVWTLQNMYERSVVSDGSKFDEKSGTVVVPENDNKIPDILDEAAYELDWMESMKVAEDEPTWGKTAAGLYYHGVRDSRLQGIAVKPWEYTGKEKEYARVVEPPTFAATLNYAACAAQAARLWHQYDSVKAKHYLQTAVDAYKAFQSAYYEADKERATHPGYKQDCYKEDISETSMYASQYNSDYDDMDVLDDAYWAVCELFVSASEMDDDNVQFFKDELEKYEGAYTVPEKIRVTDHQIENKEATAPFSYGNTAGAGTLTLALHMDLLDEKNAEKITDSITKKASEYLETEDKQGYGLPYSEYREYIDPNGRDPHIDIWGYEQGSNGSVLNEAILMAYAYDLTGGGNYAAGVTSAMDYLLGTNPLSFSFVTGYGSYSADNVNHWFWANEIDKSFPKAPDGVLSGGPATAMNYYDQYARAAGLTHNNGDYIRTSQRCYVDSAESEITNGTSLSRNASLAWVTSFLQDVYADDSVSYESIRGDINLDGKVDVTDLSTLALALVDKEELKGQSAENADVDGDGEVTLADLATIRQYLSKKITKLPVD